MGFPGLCFRNERFWLLWRKWMRGWLSTASYLNFINGRPRGKFKGSRGLHKGDPFSPFLFTVVVDGLGRLIDKA